MGFSYDRQIDWAHLVKYRMHKALRTNTPLLYPQLVTLFLRHFQIPLDDEPFVQVKRSLAIGAGTVTSFGYRKDIDGKWIKKQDLPPLIPNERTPSPPSQRDASSTLMHVVLSKLCGLRAFVGDRFDAMDSRLDAMDAHFEGRDTQINQLKDDISFIRRCFDPSTAP